MSGARRAALAKVELALGARRYRMALEAFGAGRSHRWLARKYKMTRQAVERHLAEIRAAFPALAAACAPPPARHRRRPRVLSRRRLACLACLAAPAVN